MNLKYACAHVVKWDRFFQCVMIKPLSIWMKFDKNMQLSIFRPMFIFACDGEETAKFIKQQYGDIDYGHYSIEVDITLAIYFVNLFLVTWKRPAPRPNGTLSHTTRILCGKCKVLVVYYCEFNINKSFRENFPLLIFWSFMTSIAGASTSVRKDEIKSGPRDDRFSSMLTHPI